MSALSSVRTTTLEFLSADEKSQIHARVWWPPNIEPVRLDATAPPAASNSAAKKSLPKPRPRAIVEIVHGMAEHISRYDEVARTLAVQGFLVCGHDQIGHGDSATLDRWGCIPEHGGKEMLLEDIGRLRGIVCGACATDVPFFLLGHSFGSFLVRSYVARYPQGVAGAIISGTGFVEPSKSRLGNLVAHLVCRTRGEDTRSNFLHSMADGAYAKAIPGARTPFDWLSYNRDNVDTYIADPACGFMFSAGGYATLTDLTAETCSPDCAGRVPHGLPLLFVSGVDDPVGDFGQGVRKAYELARQAGSTDVTLKLYSGMRHEILNEDGNGAVYEDLIDWLKERS